MKSSIDAVSNFVDWHCVISMVHEHFSWLRLWLNFCWLLSVAGSSGSSPVSPWTGDSSFGVWTFSRWHCGTVWGCGCWQNGAVAASGFLCHSSHLSPWRPDFQFHQPRATTSTRQPDTGGVGWLWPQVFCSSPGRVTRTAHCEEWAEWSETWTRKGWGSCLWWGRWRWQWWGERCQDSRCQAERSKTWQQCLH